MATRGSAARRGFGAAGRGGAPCERVGLLGGQRRGRLHVVAHFAVDRRHRVGHLLLDLGEFEFAWGSRSVPSAGRGFCRCEQGVSSSGCCFQERPRPVPSACSDKVQMPWHGDCSHVSTRTQNAHLVQQRRRLGLGEPGVAVQLQHARARGGQLRLHRIVEGRLGAARRGAGEARLGLWGAPRFKGARGSAQQAAAASTPLCAPPAAGTRRRRPRAGARR